MSLKSRKQEFLQRLENVQKEVRELHASLKSETETRLKPLRAKEARIEKLKRDRADQEKHRIEISEQIANLKQQITKQKENDAKKDAIYTKNVEEKRAKINQLLTQIETLKKEVVELDKAHKNAKLEQNMDIAGKELRITVLEQSEQTVDGELQETLADLENLQEQVVKLQAEHERLCDENRKKTLEKEKEREKLYVEIGRIALKEDDDAVSMLDAPKKNNYPTKVLPETNKITVPFSTVSEASKTPATARKVVQTPKRDVIEISRDDDDDSVETVVQDDERKFGVLYDDSMMKHHKPEDKKEKEKEKTEEGYVKKQVNRDIVVFEEQPKRIQVIFNRLISSKFFDRPSVIRINSRKATNDELLLCHDQEYIDLVNYNVKNNIAFMEDEESSDESGSHGGQDPDLYSVPSSIEAIYLAAGCAAQLADAFLNGSISRGVAIVRPPGHHAAHNRAAGFCFFNNAAICAVKLANAGKKVLIVDYDVHLGDGTIDILEQKRKNNDLIHYYSIHRYNKGKFYPYSDLGESTPENEDLRITLTGFNSSVGDKYYKTQFENRFDPEIFKWKPDVIVASAGFDAALNDLGGCKVTAKGYSTMTKILYSYCPNILMVLEGGYDLQQLQDCAYAAIDTLEKLKE